MKQLVKKASLFTLTFLLLIFLRLYLTVFGFGNLINLLKKKRSSFLHIDKMNYIKKYIEISSSIIPRTTCLLKAAALKLTFNNISNLHIIIGIRINKNHFFESHAWINHNDEVILNNNPKISSYKIIYTV